jgi:rubrerythrin
MLRENSKHSHHGHRHHHIETDHTLPHDELHAEESSLSHSDRLIIRLQHTIRHNHDHTANYRSMAEKAQEIGAEEAARWIRDAAEQSARQTEALEKALAALKNP